MPTDEDYGYGYGIHRDLTYPTPRESLISALAAVSDNEKALAVVDALDTYLAEDPTGRLPMREDLSPNPDAMRRERDTALEVAAHAKESLQRALAEIERMADALRTTVATTGLCAVCGAGPEDRSHTNGNHKFVLRESKP